MLVSHYTNVRSANISSPFLSCSKMLLHLCHGTLCNDVQSIPDLAKRQSTTIGGRSATMLEVIAPDPMHLPIVQLALRVLHVAHEFGRASTALNLHSFSIDKVPILVPVAAIRLPPQGFEAYNPFAPLLLHLLRSLFLDSDAFLCSSRCHGFL